MKTNRHLDDEEEEMIERIKILLEIPPAKRQDKTLQKGKLII